MTGYHLTLERMADELHLLLQGCTLTDAWTQQPDQIVLRWAGSQDNRDHTLVVNTGSAVEVYLEPRLQRQRKNAVSVLPTVIGQQCHAVVKVAGDRILTCVLTHTRLHLLLFTAGKANVVVESDGIITDAFTKRSALIGQTFTVTPTEERLGPLLEAEQSYHDQPIADLVRAESASYVVERNGRITVALLPLHGWTTMERHASILTAVRRASVLHEQRQRFHQRKHHLQSALHRELTKQRRALDHMLSDRAQADHASHYRLMADILMSQPDVRLRNVSELHATAPDGSDLCIPLQPEQSLLEAAQRFYNKARRSERSSATLQQRIPPTQQRIAELESALAAIEACTSEPELEALSTPQPPRRSSSGRTGMELQRVFREFDLGQHWTLYVGRTAANNDELTMRFAKPNDLWLHARGVSGSHCILRSPILGSSASGTMPPDHILEQAGAIAAYYSSARNATWTPVIYTQRKFVRKPKGAAVGAVVVDRERVVMVEPGLPTTERPKNAGSDHPDA